MFELIPSEYMREYFKEIGFEFTDFQKATLIWNAAGKTWKERINALKELADMTEDKNVKTQIRERIEFEEKKFVMLKDNSSKGYVYVVKDKESYSEGFFGTYELALKYAKKYSMEYNEKCSIEKQLIVQSNEDEIVRASMRVNPNMISGIQEELVEYDGCAVSSIYLDLEGNIIWIGSNELSKEEEDKVDEFKTDRFEFQFIKMPFDMLPGLPVKDVCDGSYGVLKDGKEGWEAYLKKIEEKNLYVDFSDIAVTVYKLTESGIWSHEHINPLYLEIETPSFNREDGKSIAFSRATEALSDYFTEKYYKNKENADGTYAVKFAKEYAEICKREEHWEKVVSEAKTVEDILW